MEWIENDISRSIRLADRVVLIAALFASGFPFAMGLLFPRILLAGIALLGLGPAIFLLHRIGINRTPREVLIEDGCVVLRDRRGRETSIDWGQVAEVRRNVSRLEPGLCWMIYHVGEKEKVVPLSSDIVVRLERKLHTQTS